MYSATHRGASASAEQIIESAKREADRIVSNARAKAERVAAAADQRRCTTTNIPKGTFNAIDRTGFRKIRSRGLGSTGGSSTQWSDADTAAVDTDRSEALDTDRSLQDRSQCTTPSSNSGLDSYIGPPTPRYGL